MASVDLTALPISACVPVPVEFGGPVTPLLGGAGGYVDRMGSRWAFQMATPAMRVEPDGRRWEALFGKAARAGGLFRIRIPGFDAGAPGSPVVASNTASGRAVPLAGLTPGYAIRAGQWLSLIVDGQRYCDRVEDQVIADASGNATVAISKLLRVPLTAGVVAEIGVPKVEGTVVFQAPPGWDERRLTQFSFTVTEDA